MTNSLAQITNPALGDRWNSILRTEGGEGFLNRLLPALAGLFLIAGGLLFFFYFLLGGINYITSGGDKAKLEAARTHLKNAAIGLFILLATFAIARTIEFIFGIDILSITFHPLT